MKISNLLFILFIIFFFSLPLLSSAFQSCEESGKNPFDYARITEVEYKAVVVDEPGSEGKVIITERLTFDIHAASRFNLFWELWRDLPEDYIDGLKVDYKVNSVKQILDDGSEIIYEESPRLYWEDDDYTGADGDLGPGKWFHSEGPYDEDLEQYECVLLYVDGLYREEVVFEIEYEMYNAALRYNDCSDLYLALYSGETITYLESYKAEILFPDKDMPSQGNYTVTTYGTNSNSFEVSESATANPGYYTFSFELDKNDLKFRPYNQYIEFDLVSFGEDKHIFTEYAPNNYYSYDNVLGEITLEQQQYKSVPTVYSYIKWVLFAAFGIASLIIIILSLTVGRRLRSKFVFYKPTTKIQYFRDIPSDLDPNFAAALVFCKHKAPKDNSGVSSAILLSLARKKYIKLIEGNNDTVTILVNDVYKPSYEQLELNPYIQYEDYCDMREPLTICEEYYFNLIVHHSYGYSMTMGELESRIAKDYEHTDTFVRNIEKSIVNIGIKEMYFQKADFEQPKNKIKAPCTALVMIGFLSITLVNIIAYQSRIDLAFGAFTIFGISCILSAVFRYLISKNYILLTQFGEDEYEKWRGLYNFLSNETLIKERSISEVELWEKYLVYATAFGISDKIIDILALKCPDTSNISELNNNYYRSGRYRHTGRHFRRHVHHHSSYSHHGGGFGGHGGGGFGFGGGGRGGGGGGGGH